MQSMSVAAGWTERERTRRAQAARRPPQSVRHPQSILRAWSASMLLVCSSVSLLGPAEAAGLPANVDATRLGEADREPGNWMTYGRTYSEQRFSPSVPHYR